MCTHSWHFEALPDLTFDDLRFSCLWLWLRSLIRTLSREGRTCPRLDNLLIPRDLSLSKFLLTLQFTCCFLKAHTVPRSCEPWSYSWSLAFVKPQPYFSQGTWGQRKPVPFGLRAAQPSIHEAWASREVEFADSQHHTSMFRAEVWMGRW